MPEAGAYEKIIARLIEYNERMNEGKEISVVGYLKRLDSNDSFTKSFEVQRLIKRGFNEEFKIHSLNYIVLLFESVMRIITTLHPDTFEDKKNDNKSPLKADASFYSKNYKKFLENRQKKLDKFIVNCVGWSHVNRCIEVIDMALRDLMYQIIPSKVIVRELMTSTGKVLTKDSEYILVEKKRYVTVGKKTQVDYVFELDLKEDPEKIKAM